MFKAVYLVTYISIFILLMGSLDIAKSAPLNSNNGILIQEIKTWQNEIRQSDLSDIEKDLRLEFTHRMLFEIQQKSRNLGRKDILNQSMRNILLTDQMVDNRGQSRILPYLEQLNSAVKNIIEPREDLLIFIKTYTAYSSIHQPLPHEEFGQSRHYMNGSEVIEADPMSPAEAAAYAEEKLKADPLLPSFLNRNLLNDFQTKNIQQPSLEELTASPASSNLPSQTLPADKL